MALFLKQTEQRSQLQSKIAADMRGRMQVQLPVGDPLQGGKVQEEQTAATGRSLFWVGVITMVVIAAIVFILFVAEGI